MDHLSTTGLSDSQNHAPNECHPTNLQRPQRRDAITAAVVWRLLKPVPDHSLNAQHDITVIVNPQYLLNISLLGAIFFTTGQRQYWSKTLQMGTSTTLRLKQIRGIEGGGDIVPNKKNRNQTFYFSMVAKRRCVTLLLWHIRLPLHGRLLKSTLLWLSISISILYNVSALQATIHPPTTIRIVLGARNLNGQNTRIPFAYITHCGCGQEHISGLFLNSSSASSGGCQKSTTPTE